MKFSVEFLCNGMTSGMAIRDEWLFAESYSIEIGYCMFYVDKKNRTIYMRAIMEYDYDNEEAVVKIKYTKEEWKDIECRIPKEVKYMEISNDIWEQVLTVIIDHAG